MERTAHNITTPTLLMKDEGIKSVACGSEHTMILKKNGQLMVLGRGISGELGLANIAEAPTPTFLMEDDQIEKIACGYRHSLIFKKNGDLLAFGDNGHGALGMKNTSKQNFPVVSMRGVRAAVVMGEQGNPVFWSFEDHYFFDQDFQNSIFVFLLSMKRTLPSNLKLPKPLLSIVINNSLEML